MYLTYEEYQSMGGTLDLATFDDLEFEAEATVNWHTFNRLKNDTNIPYEVKRLIKYLVTLASNKIKAISLADTSDSESGGGIIKSQSNDGVSITYEVPSAKEILDNIKAESENAIGKYLQGVTNEAGRKLLYRGLYPGE